MKHVFYYVRTKGLCGHFAASGYSKHATRQSAKDAGKLRGHVYGIKQCREHIKELRGHVYEGRRIHKNSVFEIVREVHVTTVVGTSA